MTMTPATTMVLPAPGQVVRLRSRTYLAEAVNRDDLNGTIVSLVCLDDDAQGQPLEVVWEIELDAEILGSEAWKDIGKRGFDQPRQFGAYFHTLRWNCVTATDPRLFQSPFRAGIKLDAYQLEPLRKALLLPRVNLFIADDVGLGKTIEAGLIASELMLRRRVHEIVVACPPSMLQQWKDELEIRFGLTFEVLDRAYLKRVREERGYSVNPWTTFPRFLISHKLLIDELYTAPLRDWLDNIRPGTLFIFDEAHHAAPASGTRYAIDSRLTNAVRDLANRFEHRLFLSATPHNGHSNSFSALLEILDPQRFTRGVKVRAKDLDPVMVRRLKDDVREIAGGFPKRVVKQIDLTGLPPDAPELVLSKLLDQYREVRTQRMMRASKRKQAEAALLVSGLQQRLLSSIDAFARTAKVHRRTMEGIWTLQDQAAPTVAPIANNELELLSGDIDRDDDRSQLPENELEALEDQAIAQATKATAGNPATANTAEERRLLDRMIDIADTNKTKPDARVEYLIGWIRDHMCQGAHLPNQPTLVANAMWNEVRILIFTEYEDTQRSLVQMLRAALSGTDHAEQRIEVYHGPTPPDKREAIKRAFNMPPDQHPVRILVATDAAREGLNLQAHCHNLFHFDVPWNPSRLEQRNGRIDRKLQPALEVFCHYFVYSQRPEDRILRTLVKKTDRIREELGSLSQVLENRLADMIRYGISHADVDQLAAVIDSADLDDVKQNTTREELEATRERHEALQKQVDTLRNRINDARRWIGLDMDQLRDAISCSLEMQGAEPLTALPDDDTGNKRYAFPNLDKRRGADPTWASTLDTLRALPEDGKRNFNWRKESPIRPVRFEASESVDDTAVQLHLQHRIVQRLLNRFQAQGFVHHDLSRACLAQSVDAIPRVVLLGRLALYGNRAVRLHEEIITVTARWNEPGGRRSPLRPYGRDAEARTMELLEQSLRPEAKKGIAPQVEQRLLAAIERDIDDLLPHLQTRGDEMRGEADARLKLRGEQEANAMLAILEDQKRRVSLELEKSKATQLPLEFSPEERRQFESNRRYWQSWLKNVEGDIQVEPARNREFYVVRSYRIEPIGLAYLWPQSG